MEKKPVMISITDYTGKERCTIELINNKLVAKSQDPGFEEMIQNMLDKDKLLPKNPAEAYAAIPHRYSNLSRYAFEQVDGKHKRRK